MTDAVQPPYVRKLDRRGDKGDWVVSGFRT